MSAVTAMLGELDDIGRDDRGGWTRPGFGPEVARLQAWFEARAAAIGLDVSRDRNGNVWAWWGAPGRTPWSPAATSTRCRAAAGSTAR